MGRKKGGVAARGRERRTVSLPSLCPKCSPLSLLWFEITFWTDALGVQWFGVLPTLGFASVALFFLSVYLLVLGY